MNLNRLGGLGIASMTVLSSALALSIPKNLKLELGGEVNMAHATGALGFDSEKVEFPSLYNQSFSSNNLRIGPYVGLEFEVAHHDKLHAGVIGQYAFNTSSLELAHDANYSANIMSIGNLANIGGTLSIDVVKQMALYGVLTCTTAKIRHELIANPGTPFYDTLRVNNINASHRYFVPGYGLGVNYEVTPQVLAGLQYYHVSFKESHAFSHRIFGFLGALGNESTQVELNNILFNIQYRFA